MMKTRPEIPTASTQVAVAKRDRRRRIKLPLLAGLLFCGEALAVPCFSVFGTIVAVHQFFAGEVNAKTIDLEDMPSVSTMISRGPEAHNLIFMNIKRDAAKKNVTSFSVKIDGKSYGYPKDACPKK